MHRNSNWPQWCIKSVIALKFIPLTAIATNDVRTDIKRVHKSGSCINLEHTLLNTRNPSYTGQSQSGILFLHQLLSPTQYL